MILAFTTPTWATILFLAAGVVGALGVLWQKVFKPMVTAAKRVDEAMPPISAFVTVFKDDINLITVLNAIAAEFSTDHGSTLRDVINEQTKLAKENALAITLLAAALDKAAGVQMERVLADKVTVELAVQDREQLRELIKQLDRLTVKVDAAATVSQKVASDLAVAQTAVDGVASDLATAHDRADLTEGPHGAAGDAAAKSPVGET